MVANDENVAERAAASVRIELSDAGGATPPPVPSPSPGSGNGRIGVLALAVLLGVIAVVVFMLRPDDGETAAGTPITVPTTVSPSTVPPVRETTSTEAPAVASPPADRDHATANNDMFIFSLVEADFGWFALGFGQEDTTGALYRSTDGLTWDAIPAQTLPAGDVIGFDRIDNTYLLAVDEMGTWSSDQAFNFEDGDYPEHRITIWASSDAANWLPDVRPATAGIGFPYPVSFSRASYTVPMIDAATGDNALLSALLEPFVSADLAQSVCSRERRISDPSDSVVLSSCEGEPIIEIFEEEYPESFGRLERGFCLDIALSAGQQRYSTIYTETTADVEPTRVELGNLFGLFGRALDGGFLSRSADFTLEVLPAECGGAATSTDDRFAHQVLYWTPDAGLVDVSPTLGLTAATGPETVPVGADGRAFVAMGGSVWAGTSPFEEWEEVLGPPDDQFTSLSQGPARISLAFDGSLAMTQGLGKLLFAEPNGEWFEVPFGQSSPDPQLLLATDDYAIIQPDGFGSQRLVKVEFSR